MRNPDFDEKAWALRWWLTPIWIIAFIILCFLCCILSILDYFTKRYNFPKNQEDFYWGLKIPERINNFIAGKYFR